MPIYEYKCDNCNRTEDHLVPITHEAKVTCDDCNAEMRRVFSFATTNMPTQAGRKMGRK